MSGTVFKRKSRDTWSLVLYLGKNADGKIKRKWIGGFQTRKEAESYQATFSATHPTVAAGIGAYGSSRTHLAQYLDQWLQDHVKTSVKPKAYKTYEAFCRLHIVPILGHIPIAKLTPQAIEGFYSKIAQKGLSSTTVHGIAVMLKGALSKAVRWGLVGSNPADLTEIPERKRPIYQVWTPEQAKAFLQGSVTSRYHLLFATLMLTGLRLGELLRLRWENVDLKKGVLYVPGTKTPSANRAVLLPKILHLSLVSLREREHDTVLVFHTKSSKPHNPSNIRRRHFYPLLEKLKLPRIRLHDLRHFHASYLLASGTDLASVSARLGHSSRAFTLQTYAHVLVGGQEKAAEVANTLLTQSDPSSGSNGEGPSSQTPRLER